MCDSGVMNGWTVICHTFDEMKDAEKIIQSA